MLMKCKVVALLLGLTVSYAESTAYATVIIDQPLDPSSGIVSSVRSELGNNLPFPRLIVGDVFSMATTNEIGKVDWWGTYVGTNIPPVQPDDFEIRLFDVVGTTPEITPFFVASVGDVGRSDTGLDDFHGRDIFFYYTSIPNITLSSGDYLLSIVNDTSSEPSNDWSWTDHDHGRGPVWFRNNETDPWGIAGNGPRAFRLSVPEPTTLALFSLGLVGLVIVRHKKEP